MQYLETTFEKYRSTVGPSSGTRNEALSWCFINLVIFCCVLDERALMQYVKPKAAAIPCSSTSGPPATPARKNLDNTNPSLVQLPATDICIYFQTTLKQPVMYKEEQRMLHGFADYSLGYNYSGTKSGNFIVAEAKRKRQMSQAYGQLLSYMGLWYFLDSIPTMLIRKGSDDTPCA